MDATRTARLALVVALLSAALTVFNTWQLATRPVGASQADPAGRGVRGDRASESTAGTQGEGDRSWLGASGTAATSPEATRGPDAGLDMADPAVQAGIAAVVEQEEARRDEERSERFRASVLDELSAFFEEEGLDDATRQQVEAEYLRRMDAFRAMRDDVRSGAISWIEARKQMDAARESSEATLAALLGEAKAEALEERIFGGMRGGPSPR